MNLTWPTPELLAPAKNLERLKVAVTYGADAVYVGGQKYGLRARADNFTAHELAEGVAFAHKHQAKLYVTLNAFLHDEDFEGLEAYCQFLESIGVDAVIVSDLGVMRYVQRSSRLDIHLSTQASCLNVYAARAWQALGVKRLILGRELSIAEAGKIRREAGIDVELFVHGAMCMAYSGHCTISNFTAGRDSNRGGCIQSCRFPYQLQGAKNAGFVALRDLQTDPSPPNPLSHLMVQGRTGLSDEPDFETKLTQSPSPQPTPRGRGSFSSPPPGPVLSEVEGGIEGGLPALKHLMGAGESRSDGGEGVFSQQPSTETPTGGVAFMSSKDLWGLHQIGDFFEHGICSLKIEGRMKSSLYVATTVKAYRRLIDAYAAGELTDTLLNQTGRELASIPHRDYFAGSLNGPAGQDSVFGQLSGINVGSCKYLGLVLDTTPQHIILRLYEQISVGDEIEVLTPQPDPVRWQVTELFSIVGEPVDAMRKDSVVCLPKTGRLQNVAKMNVVRYSTQDVV